MLVCVQVSQCDHTMVLYEIALSMQRLVRKYAHSLETMEWDSIYAILEAVQSHAHHHFTAQPNHVLIQVLPSVTNFCEIILFHFFLLIFPPLSSFFDPTAILLLQVLQDLFSIASELHDGSHFNTDPNKFYAVVESSLWLQQVCECEQERVSFLVERFLLLQPSLVLQLMAYHMREVRVGESGWLEQLNTFFLKFYKPENTPIVVRLEALKHLSLLVGDYSLIYEVTLTS